MKGVRFLTDENGKKVAVQIELEKYRELWEDFYDVLTAEQRVEEPSEPYLKVREKIMRKRKLHE